MSNAGMYGKKPKKREIDPGAPPRPTLLGHEKVIKDAKAIIEIQEHEIQKLKIRVETLERKLVNQNAEISAIYQMLRGRR